MVTRDDGPKETKGVEEKADKKSAKKPTGSKKSEKQPYAGTHGYTEQEVNEIIRDRKRKK